MDILVMGGSERFFSGRDKITELEPLKWVTRRTAGICILFQRSSAFKYNKLILQYSKKFEKHLRTLKKY